ncbi:hypothetical protein IQ235_15890 [Oscillatoriales cyanobacterium LEGE 11467]|uniref:Uncharacterized protein n=1 Tax=Zarconia navalis LEGE 11467 TaxID=1828826 RepID=A0A928W2W3_9CYAN|nr:hypothetical protein [Zarconia navalis]MBE9042260.1 hypothetical protein [Zarconia navalis LEGE 11467]
MLGSSCITGPKTGSAPEKSPYGFSADLAKCPVPLAGNVKRGRGSPEFAMSVGEL